ncbi:hypothetical protein WDW37_11120 [Bdellovibrionota bacterium FG-1]
MGQILTQSARTATLILSFGVSVALADASSATSLSKSYPPGFQITSVIEKIENKIGTRLASPLRCPKNFHLGKTELESGEVHDIRYAPLLEEIQCLPDRDSNTIQHLKLRLRNGYLSSIEIKAASWGFTCTEKDLEHFVSSIPDFGRPSSNGDDHTLEVRYKNPSEISFNFWCEPKKPNLVNSPTPIHVQIDSGFEGIQFCDGKDQCIQADDAWLAIEELAGQDSSGPKKRTSEQRKLEVKRIIEKTILPKVNASRKEIAMRGKLTQDMVHAYLNNLNALYSIYERRASTK